MNIINIKDRFENLTKNNKKIYSKFQFEVNEVWELLDKKLAFPILARFLKNNPKSFYKAKNYIYGLTKDGIIVDNKARYFMWLIKFYNKQI